MGPEIYYTDHRTLCAMCQWPGTDCAECYSIRYCSKRCQSIDWPAHKLLCRKFRPFLKSRPSKDFRMGIWFQRDNDRPQLVWVPFFYSEETIRPFFDHFLDPQPMRLLWTLPFRRNNRRGLDLGYPITIYYPDYDEVINKSLHRAVEACHGMTVPTTMRGNYVVLSGPAQHSAASHRDMTLADFRHTLDYFSTYFDDTIRDMPNTHSTRVLKISNPLEGVLYGRETFTTVWVDRDFVSTSTISALAKALLGYEIRVCQMRGTADEMERQSIDAEGCEWENPYAKVLMTDIDPSGERWGEEDNWNTKVSAILLREDRQDLDTELAEMMCRYCVDVLKPLFAKSLRLKGEVPRSEVLLETSQDRMSLWIKREKDRQEAEGEDTGKTG